MRTFFRFMCVCIVLFSSCAEKKKKKMNFKFIDSSGQYYNLLTFHDQFITQFMFDPFIILIETTEQNNKEYHTQLQILEKLPAESLKLIYVTSNTTEENDSGYHTSVSTAKQIAGDKLNFRITILSSKGVVLKRSTRLLNAEEIIDIIQNNKS